MRGENLANDLLRRIGRAAKVAQWPEPANDLGLAAERPPAAISAL